MAVYSAPTRYLDNPAPDTCPEPGRAFFVSALDDTGRKLAIVAGPYPTFGDARRLADASRRLERLLDAKGIDVTRSPWWSWGVCQAPQAEPSRLGYIEPPAPRPHVMATVRPIQQCAWCGSNVPHDSRGPLEPTRPIDEHRFCEPSCAAAYRGY